MDAPLPELFPEYAKQPQTCHILRLMSNAYALASLMAAVPWLLMKFGDNDLSSQYNLAQSDIDQDPPLPKNVFGRPLIASDGG